MSKPKYEETGKCRTCGKECVALATLNAKVTWCERGHVIVIDEVCGREVYDFHK